MKTFIYCRIASSEQMLTQQEVLVAQEAKCRKYAQSQHHEVVNIYKDIGQMHGGVFLERFRNLLDTLASTRQPVLILADTVLRLGFEYTTREKALRLIHQHGGQFLGIDEEVSYLDAFLREEEFRNQNESNEKA